jgi:hypothetical protein
MELQDSIIQEFEGKPIPPGEYYPASPRPADRPRVVPEHDPTQVPEPPIFAEFVGVPVPKGAVSPLPRPLGRERNVPGDQPSTPPTV